jgi:hypothetical protein
MLQWPIGRLFWKSQPKLSGRGQTKSVQPGRGSTRTSVYFVTSQKLLVRMSENLISNAKWAKLEIDDASACDKTRANSILPSQQSSEL